MTHQTDERMDPLKALREELASVAPPAEFAARVRLGIDADTAVRGANWLTGWRWLVPAAAAAAMVAAVFVMWRPTTEAPHQVVAQAPIETSNPLAAPQETVAPLPAPAGVSRADSSKFDVRSSNSGRKVAAASFGGQAREPVLEVITNQAAVLRELWARVDSTATLVETVAKTSPDTVPEIVVNPIEVNPIVIKWLGDPSTAPGAPIIRRITANTAERSEK